MIAYFQPPSMKNALFPFSKLSPMLEQGVGLESVPPPHISERKWHQRDAGRFDMHLNKVVKGQKTFEVLTASGYGAHNRQDYPSVGTPAGF